MSKSQTLHSMSIAKKLGLFTFSAILGIVALTALFLLSERKLILEERQSSVTLIQEDRRQSAKAADARELRRRLGALVRLAACRDRERARMAGDHAPVALNTTFARASPSSPVSASRKRTPTTSPASTTIRRASVQVRTWAPWARAERALRTHRRWPSMPHSSKVTAPARPGRSPGSSR
jgi:hypothetical protein